jgi:F-type H+-transporting ATPase subunit b
LAEAIRALGINLPSLIAQLVNFSILLAVMYFVVWPRLRDGLDERRRRIQEGLEASTRAQERAAQAEAEVQAQLEQARREGQNLIAQSQQIGSRLQEESRQQAQQEAEALLARARNEIQLERDTAIAELRREFGDLTIAAAEKVISQSLDRQAHQRLIEEVLTDSSFQGTGSKN